MPVTATTRFYAWVSRKGRHHGGSFVELIMPEPVSNYNGGGSETFNAGFAPDELPLPGSTTKVKFGFWSVAGGADGGVIGAAGQKHAPAVSVGTANVVATAWYLPEGGGGNGGPGVWIDAFDINVGDFVDDDFVNVTSTPALTAVANSDGWVPSDSAQTVAAYGAIHFVPFKQWNVEAGAETVSGVTLSVAATSSAVVFAFYKTPVGSEPGIVKINPDKMLAWRILFGIINDGNGLEWGPGGPHPVGPWGPDILKVANKAMMIAVSSKMAKTELARAVADLNKDVKALSGKMNGK